MRRFSGKALVSVLCLSWILALTIVWAQIPPPQGGWIKDENNPVLVPGQPVDWDGGGVSAPAVIYSDGLFQMWYTGEIATDTAQVARTVIGLATSSDGTRWEKDTRNPVLPDGARGEWDAEGVSDAAILKRDDMYHMWYAGVDGSGKIQIGYAQSSDGAVWTKHEDNPVLEPGPEDAWDMQRVRPGTVLWIEGEYRMWYTGVNVFGTAQIGYATSEDGVIWSKHPRNPVLPFGDNAWDRFGVYRPAVVFDGQIYRMWYTGVGEDGVHRINLATSPDGINWVKAAENPELQPDPADLVGIANVSQPAVVYDGTREPWVYHMWYAARQSGPSDFSVIYHATKEAGYFLYLPLVGQNMGSE